MGLELIFILLINCQDRYKIENPSDIEILTIEMTIRKNKILVAGIYKPPNLSETHFTTNPETIISKLSNKYEKLILMVDFNMTTTAWKMPKHGVISAPYFPVFILNVLSPNTEKYGQK